MNSVASVTPMTFFFMSLASGAGGTHFRRSHSFSRVSVAVSVKCSNEHMSLGVK